jgi:hypothetical protein
VVAPVGTAAAIKELEITVKVAAVPLKVTLVAPFRFVPRMLISVPTLAAVGSVFTNGAQACGEAEYCATRAAFLGAVEGPARVGCSVQIPVGGLEQPSKRGVAKGRILTDGTSTIARWDAAKNMKLGVKLDGEIRRGNSGRSFAGHRRNGGDLCCAGGR